MAPRSQDSDQGYGQRGIGLVGEVSSESAGHVIGRLFELSEQDARDPIILVIHTEGGDAYASLAIADAIRVCRAPVVTIGLGAVMSAGVLILASGLKGSRMIGRSCRVMCHGVASSTSGRSRELEVDLEEHRAVEDRMMRELSAATGKRLATVRGWHHGELDRYFGAAEAVKRGLADKVI